MGAGARSTLDSPKKKTQKELEEEEEEQEGRRERDQCPTKQLLLLRFDNRLR